jgi:hypothetical protein
MKLDPGMRIGMHLVSFGKSCVTLSNAILSVNHSTNPGRANKTLESATSGEKSGAFGFYKNQHRYLPLLTKTSENNVLK